MTIFDERARLRFDPQFLFATDKQGKDIRFTRAGATPQVTQIAKMITADKAGTIMNFTYYLCGRLFKDEQHRINLMKGPLVLLANNLGYDFVPENVRIGLPSFFDNV